MLETFCVVVVGALQDGSCFTKRCPSMTAIFAQDSFAKLMRNTDDEGGYSRYRSSGEGELVLADADRSIAGTTAGEFDCGLSIVEHRKLNHLIPRERWRRTGRSGPAVGVDGGPDTRELRHTDRGPVAGR